MNAVKLLGLSTGAGAAVIGLYAWSALTHVSDEDRLLDVLANHCLPYVTEGATPFAGMGRQAGVYERDDLNEAFTGHAILFDDRFLAQWGEAEGDNGPIRACQVSGRAKTLATLNFFNVPLDVPVRIAQVLPDGLKTDADVLPQPVGLLGYYEQEIGVPSGLRIVLSAVEGGILSVLMADDL